MKHKSGFLDQMREATHVLQSSGPAAATAVIQRALREASGNGQPERRSSGSRPQPVTIEINPPAREAAGGKPGILERLRRLTGGKAGPARQPIEDVEAAVAAHGKFLSGSFTNASGTRAYKLYVPGGYAGEPLPLIVMLHGCTQHPDDFAAGTAMNAVAEENHCFVLYPAQTKAANGSNCWNWFRTEDQRRDQGEPSIIAGMTQEIMRSYRIDASRVYVAGLSAGGAMAAVMGATYPELYAAVGIHSGLPYGAAHDVPSAFGAMSNGSKKPGPLGALRKVPAPEHTIPVIVFHGDRDTTVHPGNGDQALAQWVPVSATPANGAKVKVENGRVPGGRAYTRTILHGENGDAIAEQWVVHGAGHAWSGGSSQGTYTDPQGPSASREMVRFFFSQRRNAR